MRTTDFKHYFYALITVLMFSSNAIAQKIEIKDGTKIIHNEGSGLWADDDDVRIEKVGILGEIESEDENYMFFMPIDISVDKDGNIYIVDSGSHRIQKFDKDLKYLRTIGRKGQGPEEFILPQRMEIDPDGNLDVIDLGNRRVTKLTPDGEYLETFRIMSGKFNLRYLKNGDILRANPKISGNFGKNGKGVPLIHLLDHDRNIKRKIGVSHFFDDYKDMRKYVGANYFYYAIDAQENIYITFKYQNRIEKYSLDGKQVFTMDRPESKLFPANRRDKPFAVAGSYDIGVDSKGRIWVASRKKFAPKGSGKGVGINETGSYEVRGESGQLDFDIHILELFSTDGILLKTFTLDHWIDSFRIINDKIYALDKFRGMRYNIYDIQIDK